MIKILNEDFAEVKVLELVKGFYYINISVTCIYLSLIRYKLTVKADFSVFQQSLFTVVDAKGEQMNQGETVTVFNDMCFMAPASLIDARIKWETIDDLTVKAIFTNGSIKISAILYFNEKGELLNFVSNDRFETNGKEYKNYPWSTPVMSYTNINGYRLPSSAKLIYSRPDGEFCYGEFELVNMEYNCKTLNPLF